MTVLRSRGAGHTSGRLRRDDPLDLVDGAAGVDVDDPVPPGRAGRLDVPGDVVEEHDLPGLDRQPPGRERVDPRVGLDQPDLVRIDDVVGDVLESPAALALAGLGGRVAQDARQEARAQAGEPVEELTVQGADVPAPEVLDQLVGAGLVEPELASARSPAPRPCRSRRYRDRPGTPREAASTEPGARPRRRSKGSGKSESSLTSSTEPMSRTTARMVTILPRRSRVRAGSGP